MFGRTHADVHFLAGDALFEPGQQVNGLAVHRQYAGARLQAGQPEFAAPVLGLHPGQVEIAQVLHAQAARFMRGRGHRAAVVRVAARQQPDMQGPRFQFQAGVQLEGGLAPAPCAAAALPNARQPGGQGHGAAIRHVHGGEPVQQVNIKQVPCHKNLGDGFLQDALHKPAGFFAKAFVQALRGYLKAVRVACPRQAFHRGRMVL